MSTIIRIFLIISWVASMAVNLITIDASMSSGFLEMCLLFVCHWGRWFAAFSCLAVVAWSAVLLWQRRDRTQPAPWMHAGVLLLALGLVAVVMGPGAVRLMKNQVLLHRYYFGPASVAILDSKGNYQAAAERCHALAAQSRWSFLESTLPYCASVLENKALLVERSKAEYSRLLMATPQPTEDLAEVQKFHSYFAPNSLGRRTRLPAGPWRQPAVVFLEENSLLRDLRWGPARGFQSDMFISRSGTRP